MSNKKVNIYSIIILIIIGYNIFKIINHVPDEYSIDFSFLFYFFNIFACFIAIIVLWISYEYKKRKK